MDFSKIEEVKDDASHNNPDEQMVFRYNRAERLRHAPKIVQDYYSGEFAPYKGGLFKSLVKTRGNRLLLVTIVFMFGILIFMRAFGPQKSSGSLSGVDVNLSAFSYGDSVYASVKLSEAGKKKKPDFAEGVPVSATITAYDKENSVLFEERVGGKYDGNELFLRTTFTDYDIIRVGAVCNMGDSFASLESEIEKR